MPCPYFEPQRIARQPKHPGARLPLLDEYDGLCHAFGGPVPETERFRSCNHGYSRGECGHFPENGSGSCFRFEVLHRTADWLEVLRVEEQGYAPVQWQPFRFSIQTGRVEPEPIDACALAQLRAFCSSYLRRFSQ
ncbi:MAG: hypothetical protein JOY54_05600 [Acidobacteriaceae bacterium]|nr:hypothetical protein [Acidobacteriaceae bacterium]